VRPERINTWRNSVTDIPYDDDDDDDDDGAINVFHAQNI
jgi:hypothetical protein